MALSIYQEKMYSLYRKKSQRPSWSPTLNHMSRHTTKPTKWPVRPLKTQISLGICPVWSESSLCAQEVVKGPMFIHADSKDSDQTGRMPRLIWVFARHTGHFVGFVMRRLKSYPMSNVIKWMRCNCTTALWNSNKYIFHKIAWCWCLAIHNWYLHMSVFRYWPQSGQF